MSYLDKMRQFRGGEPEEESQELMAVAERSRKSKKKKSVRKSAHRRTSAKRNANGQFVKKARPVRRTGKVRTAKKTSRAAPRRSVRTKHKRASAHSERSPMKRRRPRKATTHRRSPARRRSKVSSRMREQIMEMMEARDKKGRFKRETPRRRKKAKKLATPRVPTRRRAATTKRHRRVLASVPARRRRGRPRERVQLVVVQGGRARRTSRRRGMREGFYENPSNFGDGMTENPLGIAELAFFFGSATAGYVLTDFLDRWLATKAMPAGADPALYPNVEGTLVLGKPSITRIIVQALVTLGFLAGGTYVQSPKIRSSLQGMGAGAGVHLLGQLWNQYVMTKVFTDKDGKATPNGQRLYFPEIQANAFINAPTTPGPTSLDDWKKAGIAGLPQYARQDIGPFASMLGAPSRGVVGAPGMVYVDPLTGAILSPPVPLQIQNPAVPQYNSAPTSDCPPGYSMMPNADGTFVCVPQQPTPGGGNCAPCAIKDPCPIPMDARAAWNAQMNGGWGVAGAPEGAQVQHQRLDWSEIGRDSNQSRR